MASEQGTGPRGRTVADRPKLARLFRDYWPSIVGASLALAAFTTFWFVFVRQKAPGPGEEVARLTAMIGEVQLRPVGREAWARGHPSQRLHVGDLVQTEPRAAAEIAFDSGSLVHVRPDTVVHIGGSAESSTAAWRVQTGRIHFAAGEQATDILTATARTTAEAHAAGDIDVAASGATGVKVFEGRARVETREQRILLQANEAVQVDATGRAGEKLDLPPPPTPLEPASRARLPLGDTATLRWTAVSASRSYRVAIDYNVTQANLLLAAPPTLDVAGIGGTSHDLPGLDPGRYFWRVAAVNDHGLEGAFSRVSFFAVVPVEPGPAATPSPRPAPTLVVDALQPVAAGIVRLTGRAEPHSRVTVNGSPVHLMPDGSFSEYVQGTDGQTLVVREVANGAVRERILTVPR